MNPEIKEMTQYIICVIQGLKILVDLYDNYKDNDIKKNKDMLLEIKTGLQGNINFLRNNALLYQTAEEILGKEKLFELISNL